MSSLFSWFHAEVEKDYMCTIKENYTNLTLIMEITTGHSKIKSSLLSRGHPPLCSGLWDIYPLLANKGCGNSNYRLLKIIRSFKFYLFPCLPLGVNHESVHLQYLSSSSLHADRLKIRPELTIQKRMLF